MSKQYNQLTVNGITPLEATDFEALLLTSQRIGVLEDHSNPNHKKSLFALLDLLSDYAPNTQILFESINAQTSSEDTKCIYKKNQYPEAEFPSNLQYSGWDSLAIIHRGLSLKKQFYSACQHSRIPFDPDAKKSWNWPYSVRKAFDQYRAVIIDERDRYRESVLAETPGKILWVGGLDHAGERILQGLNEDDLILIPY